MIHLSATQVNELAVPLVIMCMGDDVGKKCREAFADVEGEYTDLYGFFDDDKLIAVAGVGVEISPTKVWLGYLAVHPKYRRKGYGKRALCFVEELARERGYEWILIETYENSIFDAAIALYKKHGFKQVGELPDYLDDGSDALFFRKELGHVES